jgi:hypothetical protein
MIKMVSEVSIKRELSSEANYALTVRKFRTVQTVMQFHRRPKRLISTESVDKAVRNGKIFLSSESLHGHDSERGRFFFRIPVQFETWSEYGASP